MKNDTIRFLPAVSAWLFSFAFASVATADEELAHRRLTATPFTAVKLEDAFLDAPPGNQSHHIPAAQHRVVREDRTRRQLRQGGKADDRQVRGHLLQ